VTERSRREASRRALQAFAARRDEHDDDGLEWLDLDANSTDEEIDTACRNLSRLRTPEPQQIAVRRPQVVRACPLGRAWRAMDMFGAATTDFRWTAADERERCARARAAVPIRSLGLVEVSWEVASDNVRHLPTTTAVESRAPRWKYPAGSPHHHTEVLVEADVVHIDLLDIRKSGPGRSIREVRVFVNGQLYGRGGQCGCSLGFGGGDLPAVALIGSERALTVDLIYGIATPFVELWQVAPR
jgi:hypothetical protein